MPNQYTTMEDAPALNEPQSGLNPAMAMDEDAIPSPVAETNTRTSRPTAAPRRNTRPRTGAPRITRPRRMGTSRWSIVRQIDRDMENLCLMLRERLGQLQKSPDPSEESVASEINALNELLEMSAKYSRYNRERAYEFHNEILIMEGHELIDRNSLNWEKYGPEPEK